MARAKAKAAQPALVRVKLVKSPIGYAEPQKQTLRSLGLRRLQQVVAHPDTPQLRGMISRVNHLVQVVEENR